MRPGVKFPLILIATLSLSASTARAWQSCDLSILWNTSDELSGSQNQSSQANGISSTLEATFAVGYTEGQTWTIRRTFDQGGHWKTVERGLPGNWGSSVANGIATNHRTGEIYVAGSAAGPTGLHWIVQKSDDNGFSWTIVDDFTDGQSGHQFHAQGVAVDRKGRIFVVGNKVASGTVSWITRRSEDGGAHWSTVDIYTTSQNDTSAEGAAVSSDGQVFVAGYAYLNHGFDTWVVRASADHGATWSTVDSYNLISGGSAGASGISAGPHGEIAVVGSAVDNTQDRWITRVANQSNPGSWSTVDNFGIASNFFNLAQGTTFTLDGELFVTGTTGNHGGSGDFITRQSGSAYGAFYPSDDFPSGFSPDFQGGFAATTDASGNVYAAGSVFDGGNLRWIVRKLSCQ